ncbi:YdcF family protein [Enterococcus sp. LJL128]|uniref:YdcF family protein n=1 Tax=Enterococcus sp. LJL51 TaxID=3416656 RepID=UPI003CEE6C23
MKMNFDLSLALIFLIGLVLIPLWRKKRMKSRLFPVFIWTLGCFSIYLLSLEIKDRTYFILIPLFFFCLFFFFYRREKRRLINGLLFNFFLVSFGLYLGLLAISSRSPFLIFLLAGIFVLLLLLLLVGIYALIIFLYWNAVVVWRKEGHSLANLLTLLLALALTGFLILSYVSGRYLPLWAASLFSMFPMCIAYFAIVFYNFLTISVLYQFNRPKYTQHYIIVLGAGLLNGKTVPPLLGKRIERGIQFYQKQKQATDVPPKLLMSGGKGDDEHLAESLAMKQYALEKGIPEEDILVEANSKNTLENMKFSKEIMEQDFGGTSYQAIFTTNNYHLFRAGLFAKEANIKADGIGAKTAFYFLPNAFLREFIAIAMMRKRRHLIICSLIVAMNILFAIIQLLFG